MRMSEKIMSEIDFGGAAHEKKIAFACPNCEMRVEDTIPVVSGMGMGDKKTTCKNCGLDIVLKWYKVISERIEINIGKIDYVKTLNISG